MARIAKTTTTFQPMAGFSDTFVVVEVQGQVSRTVGRVVRVAKGEWMALAVGAPAWTKVVATRKEALAQMRAGQTWMGTWDQARFRLCA